MAKIHGRPLLPWWVYALYFVFAITVAVWHNVAHGDEMKPATGKTAEKAKHGRKGDTRLAHINPMEAAILKAMGGAGTTNPKTGYKEYYDAADSGESDRFGGTGEQSFGGYSEGEARDTGMYGDQANPNSNSFDPSYSPAGPPGTPGRFDTASTTGLEGALNRALTSRTPSPFVSPTSYGMYKGMQALGEYVGKPLNDRFGGNALAEAPPSLAPETGSAGNNDYFNASLGIQPVAAPTPAFMRPAEEQAPAGLGMGGMTDLQKRAQIATGGSQGSSGQFRTPDAMRFYGNLIARALIGDNNAISQQTPNLLPIEDTYLKQVFGVTPQNNSAALLDALKPYWSR